MIDLPKKPAVINLPIKPREEIVLDQVEESIDIEADAIDFGFKTTVEGMRVGKGPDWEIWVEPLNFVLKVDSKELYFSDFGSLMNTLTKNRIKYWLSQEKWNNVDTAMMNVDSEITVLCSRIENVMKFIGQKYGISNPV
jgi:hypothetical protein